MGGNSINAAQEKTRRQERLRRDVRTLASDYPGFRFGVIAGGEAGIEATPGPGYEGDLVAVIRPDAAGIRAVLDADALNRGGDA